MCSSKIKLNLSWSIINEKLKRSKLWIFEKKNKKSTSNTCTCVGSDLGSLQVGGWWKQEKDRKKGKTWKNRERKKKKMKNRNKVKRGFKNFQGVWLWVWCFSAKAKIIKTKIYDLIKRLAWLVSYLQIRGVTKKKLKLIF